MALLTCSALPWAMLGTSVSAQTPEVKPADFPEAIVAKHRIGTRGPIYVSAHSYKEVMGQIPPTALEVVVGTDGRVLRVRALSEPPFVTFLQSAAETWRYVPFEIDGRPVVARVREEVRLRPVEESRKLAVPFPEIRDWNSLRITLIRSGCYGYCAAYKVEVHGDGTVLFQTQDFGKQEEVQRTSISKDDLLKLVEVFRRSDYFSLGDGYFALVTDNPTYTTAISFDRHAKWVMNYVGDRAGMPAAVTEVENAIDRLSGADKLVAKQVERQMRPR